MKALSIGLVAIAALIGIVLAVTGDSDDTAAVLIAPAVLYLVTAALFSSGPKRTVALKPIKLKDGNTFSVGQTVPAPVPGTDADDQPLRAGHEYKEQRGLFFIGLILGKDGRWSTSKTQVLLWTYAILFGLVSLLLALAFGDSTGWDAQTGDDLQDEYLILLGGPFAAAVLARGITGQKVENGTIQKAESDQAVGPLEGVSEIVSDDTGQTDLADTQYFLFNLVALVYFIGAFVFDVDGAFPDMPELLVGLTSVSAAGYVAKKAAERTVPVLTSVLPTKQRAGQEVEIWGRNLILSGTSGPGAQLPHIYIADQKVTDITVVRSSGDGGDHLRVRVPASAAVGETHLRLVTAAGVGPVDPQPLEVLPAV